jgi:hypothetical protein
LIVQGVLALTFHTCIYHSLIRLTWLTYSFSITLLPYYSTGYNALYYIIFIHRWTASTFFTQTFSFPLLPPIIPSDRPTNAILFSLSPSHYIYILYVNISIYIYDHISICVNIYLIGLACTYEGKCDLWLLGLAHLAQMKLPGSIHLLTKNRISLFFMAE